jgi:GT2 family glycosyltransferase
MQGIESCKLAVILVLYRTYNDVEDFLQRQSVNRNVFYIVVDNTPHNEIDVEASERIGNFRNVSLLIANPENLGYAGAAHFAMQQCPELRTFDFVAISNTDLSYDASSVLAVLQRDRADLSNVGAIAPRLVKSNGDATRQLHYVSKPTRRKFSFLVKVFSSYPVSIFYRLLGDLKRFMVSRTMPADIPRYIFAPHGALMIVTQEYLKKTSGFKHPAFLFCEEITIGVQCEQAKLLCVYVPDITYSHRNHGSMGWLPSKKVVGYLHEAHKSMLSSLEK